MRKYFTKYRGLILLGVGFLLLESLVDVLQPAIISRLIDQGVIRGDMATIKETGILLLVLTGLGVLFALGRTAMAARVSTALSADLRVDLFDKIQQLSLRQIDHISKASMITRLTNDVNQIQNLVNGMLRIFLKAPFILAGSLLMVSWMNWKLAMIVYLSLPLILIILILNAKLAFPFYQRLQRGIDGLNTRTGEFLSGLKVIRCFDSKDKERQLFQSANEELYQSTTSAMRVSAFFNPLVSLVLNLALVLILYYGGILKVKGEVLPGQLLAFVNYMTKVMFSANLLGAIFNTLIRGRASYDRILEILHLQTRSPEDILSQHPDEDEDFLVEKLEFQKVGFTYPAGKTGAVLFDISFTLERGQTLGIIGGIGSGKSTLANLITGLYEIEQGSIRINGRDIKAIPGDKLRYRMAVVPQKTTLFSATIADNLRWGRQEATEEELRQALELARAWDFVEDIPGKLQGSMEGGGANLSGGQAQRLSMARAFIRNPQILILDDPLSKVDIRTELEIRKNLEQNQDQRITILISQKILSVSKADKILVLEKGRMKGLGTHLQLLADCQEYRDIYQSQIGGDFDER